MANGASATNGGPSPADTVRTATANALKGLLDRLAADGRRVRFWWRDDDAVRPTPALDRLLKLAAAHDVPLALAVIPAAVEPALAHGVAARPAVRILQHGHAHTNHAAARMPKAELGADRPTDVVIAELAAGRERLADLFGDRFLPVLVPPWNRAAPNILAAAGAAGYRGVSLFKGHDAGPFRIDTHLDPVAWWTTRGFAGVGSALAPLAAVTDPSGTAGTATVGPIGLLTHHLVHDAATWAFVEAFVAIAADHPAAAFADPADLFRGP